VPDPIEAAAALAASCDAAVVCVGLSNLSEGGTLDRQSYAMPGRQVELVRRVAAANRRTVVVLIHGSVVSLSEWIDDVPAVLDAWYPGQEGGHAIAAALFGETNPGGRLPDTVFRRAEDIVALRHYPGDGRRVVYAEGMNVGYRQLRPGGNEALFPFGFGLSYTKFELASARRDAGIVVEVRNRGERAGATVVQVYSQRSRPDVDKPWRELVAFRKIEIGPGASARVNLPLPADTFTSWDSTADRWIRDPSIDTLWVTLDTRSGIALPTTQEKP
jgi:beta-glucosidase